VFVAGTVGSAAPPPTSPPGTPAASRDVFVARYDANSRVYPGFGTSRTGEIITNLGGDDAAGDLALLADGSLVLVGTTRPQNLFDTRLSGDFVVAHFAPDGTLDPAFGGGDGVATVDFGGADAASAVAVDADGNIVAGGQAYVAGRSTDFALARLQGTGVLPPNVTEVSLGGSAFSGPFLAYLGALGVGGAGGYALVNTQGLTAGRGTYLTQDGVNTVSARLDPSGRPELLGPDDVRVRGFSVADYGVASYAYDPATRVATWTLSRPIVADRVVIDLNTDNDADYESHLRADVLAGDANGSYTGPVNALDVADVKRRLGKTATLPPTTTSNGYSYLADVNGDGRINALDVAAVKKNLAHALPAGAPPLVAGAAAPASGAASVTRELFGTEPVLA
jgi:hypothetical protein